MQWSNQAVILGTRKFGETNCILEVLSRDHGRHLGLVRGGRSRNLQPMLQPGNLVEVTWRARLADHLGYFNVEPMKLRAASLMDHPLGILGVQTLAGLLRLLPERDPHPMLFDALAVILEHLAEPLIAGATLVRFELQILNELGFGLDLSKCAATGSDDELVWVSPKSGRAVSRHAGLPYSKRLLPLPGFLRPNERTDNIDMEMMEQAFALSGFFLARHVYEPRGLQWPEERDRFVKTLKGAFA